MKNTGIFITSLVGGMILGSALTMLLTPKSGADMRHSIKDLMNKEFGKCCKDCDCNDPNCDCDDQNCDCDDPNCDCVDGKCVCNK